MLTFVRAANVLVSFTELIAAKAKDIEDGKVQANQNNPDQVPDIVLTEDELNQLSKNVTSTLLLAGPAVVRWALSVLGPALLKLGDLIKKLLGSSANLAGKVYEWLKKKFRVCKGCFPAGTLVAAESGLKPIEMIERGERVWGRHQATGRWALEVVEETQQREYRGDWATLRVGGETIAATGGHPFWVIEGEGLANRAVLEELDGDPQTGGLDGRWVSARDLRVGDLLARREGASEVEEISIEQREQTVYNLQIATAHSYAVGRRCWWVHNTSVGQCEIKAPKKIEFPADSNEFTKQLGVQPSKVSLTKDGTTRTVWEPNPNNGLGAKSKHSHSV